MSHHVHLVFLKSNIKSLVTQNQSKRIYLANVLEKRLLEFLNGKEKCSSPIVYCLARIKVA
jgi:hypothetical protein